MIVEATAARFRGIKNAYTGETMVVKMLVPERGRPMFFAPDTFTPAKPMRSAAELLDAWDREDGVGGLKNRGNLVCPYTGKPLSVVETSHGVFLDGGFNPGMLMTDDEFLYYATMRNGKPTRPAPSAVRVELEKERFDPAPAEDPVEPTDDARHAAEKVVDQFKDQVGMEKEKTTVSMPTGRTRRNR